MAADGVATRVIAREVNCAIGTAAKWRVRYAKDRTIEESAVASIILDHAMILPYSESSPDRSFRRDRVKGPATERR